MSEAGVHGADVLEVSRASAPDTVEGGSSDLI